MTNLPQSFDDSIRHEVRNGVTLYSLVDIVAQFSDTEAARQYWLDTKKRLKRDGFEVSDKILRISLTDKTGNRKQQTDVADAETCLRIVQSIPSPKAEPVRQWLARVALERMEEAADPELGIRRARERAVAAYQRQGKDSKWIAGRLDGINDRKVFTGRAASGVQL
jgi:hypothetical protein